MTPEEKERRRAQQRVVNMTPEQIERKRERQREQHRQANMTPEQIERTRAYARKRRANMSPEQLEKKRDRDRAWRASRTPDQLEHEREWKRNARQTPEQLERNREHGRKWRANLTPEQIERQRQYAQEYSRQRAYNLTPEEQRAVLKEGRCEICGNTPEVLAIDHCHSSGDFRGVLCRTCNTGIGLLGDNAAGVRAALAYLERPSLAQRLRELESFETLKNGMD